MSDEKKQGPNKDYNGFDKAMYKTGEAISNVVPDPLLKAVVAASDLPLVKDFVGQAAFADAYQDRLDARSLPKTKNTEVKR